MSNLQPASESIKSQTNFEKLFFLREDLNPYGSFKDRALSYQINYLKQEKINTCVISSSGNAAIAAAAHCQSNNIKCIILISPDTDPAKLSQIIKYQPFMLIKSANARRLANYIHKKHGIYLLNPSKDDRAITGFESLGKDIYTANPDCQTIFSYVTSGASLLGIISFYKKLSAEKSITFPHIIGVQSGAQQFLSRDVFGQVMEDSQPQMAGRNSLIKSPRSNQIGEELNHDFPNNSVNQPIINQSIGTIYWVQNDDLMKSYQLLQQHNINSSPEGAASLAAAIDFSRRYSDLKNAVVIISGKQHELVTNDNYQIHSCSTTDDIDRLFKTSFSK